MHIYAHRLPATRSVQPSSHMAGDILALSASLFPTRMGHGSDSLDSIGGAQYLTIREHVEGALKLLPQFLYSPFSDWMEVTWTQCDWRTSRRDHSPTRPKGGVAST